MRPVRDISDIENFRVEHRPGANFGFIRRDSIVPEPVGTIVICAFRITGYDKDCDGSLMARLEQIDSSGDSTGWEADSIGLHPDTDLVFSLEEFSSLFEVNDREGDQRSNE